MKLLPSLARAAAGATMVGAGIVMLAPAATAQQCVDAVPGYAKRISQGVVEFYEEGRCGRDPHRAPAPPPRPAPAPKAPASGNWCTGGIVCGDPGPVDWNIVKGVHVVRGNTGPLPPMIGKVTVGPTTRAGGGGGRSGNVTVGETTRIKDKQESNQK